MGFVGGLTGSVGFGVGRLGLVGRRFCMTVWGWWVGVSQWGLCKKVRGGWVERVSNAMSFSVWGWWVGVGWSQVVLEGLGLVGWGWAGEFVHERLGLVGWGWAIVVCACAVGVGGLELGGRGLDLRVGALRYGVGAMWAHLGSMWAHLGAMLA